MKNSTESFYTLNNSLSIPIIGYGTWRTTNEGAADAVVEAIKCGYRLIDTASVYENEKGIGEGLKTSSKERASIFLTSKVWNLDRGYDATMKAFEKSLSALGTDYLDLYLIHWPANSLRYSDPDSINLSTWKAMTELYKEGRIKAIGVSNFLPRHLEPLMECEVPPMVNQIEYHPGYTQPETIKYCHDNNILVEAWRPLGRGNIFSEPTLLNIAQKHNKSVAQICLKYAIQNNVIPLPKSVTPDRIRENIDIFDFELSSSDLAAIDNMPECGYSGLHPDTFNR